MSRSPDRRWPAARPVAAVGLVAALLVPVPSAAAQPDEAVAVVEDVVPVVDDLVFTEESLDGSETVERSDTQVTVAITSDVLFALDEDQVTPEARERLEQVADQIRSEGVAGLITVVGHTDDQGSTSYNLDLSQRRAESVHTVLAELLSGEDVTFETVGRGESQPRVPNIVDGEPSEENRAKNRRVEVVFDAPE